MRGTIHYGIRFNGPSEEFKSFIGTKENGDPIETSGLLCFVDSDWAGDQDDSKSTRGYIIFYNGSVIASKSKKDATVSLSSAEAELSALTLLTQELEWLNILLEDLGLPISEPTLIFEDNQSSIGMINDPASVTSRAKHLVIKKA